MPLFAGVEADLVTGKRFETLAIDFHQIENGRMANAWHAEDWATAISQMINQSPPNDLGFDSQFIPGQVYFPNRT